jgi:hypothetical protein
MENSITGLVVVRKRKSITVLKNLNPHWAGDEMREGDVESLAGGGRVDPVHTRGRVMRSVCF